MLSMLFYCVSPTCPPVAAPSHNACMSVKVGNGATVISHHRIEAPSGPVSTGMGEGLGITGAISKKKSIFSPIK